MNVRTHFSADWHLGHTAVIDFCTRPFRDATEMDEYLIKKHNEYVKPNDIYYHVGDLSFHPPAIGIPLLKRLNGQKVLIRGNHDKYSLTQYRSAGFQVVEEAVIELRGYRLRLSHYPLAPSEEEIKRDNLQPYDLRYMDRRPKILPTEWLIHGHVHGQWKCKDRQINVGCDVWDYHPVSESQLERLLGNWNKINQVEWF